MKCVRIQYADYETEWRGVGIGVRGERVSSDIKEEGKNQRREGGRKRRWAKESSGSSTTQGEGWYPLLTRINSIFLSPSLGRRSIIIPGVTRLWCAINGALHILLAAYNIYKTNIIACTRVARHFLHTRPSMEMLLAHATQRTRWRQASWLDTRAHETYRKPKGQFKN